MSHELSYINNLVIEVTRRCNMQCPHCLRGTAQRIDMNLEYVKKLFSQVKFLGSLTLTGGEPSLVPNIIDEIIDLASIYNVEIQNFYCVTNAKRVPDRFLQVIKKLYNYCSDNEISQLCYSKDAFHDALSYRSLDKLEEFKYELDIRSEYLVSAKQGANYGNLINEGRANENGLGTRRLTPSRYRISKYNQEINIDEGEIYLNCQGKIVSCCDLSYKSQKKSEFVVCDVMKNDLLPSILTYNRRTRRIEE